MSEPSPELPAAIALFHRRWSIPIVTFLGRSGTSTFTQLTGRIGASRETIAETLRSLTETALVRRTGPGTRAAYSLTDRGQALYPYCAAAAEAVVAADILAIALKKWPMVVLSAAGRGISRFRDLRIALGGITSRSLSDALKDLGDAGLVERTVQPGFPPGTAYELTASGRQVWPAIDALVRACGREVVL